MPYSAFEIQHRTNVHCVLHLHTEAEFVLVTEGVLHVLLQTETIELHEGDGLFIQPLELHGYKTEKHSACTILVFSPDVVPDFASAITNCQPQQTVFRPSKAVKELCSSLDPFIHYDTLHSCSILHPLCCEIVDRCGFGNSHYKQETTFIRVQRYILEHIAEELTLTGTAAALGLNSSYLSRMFHQVRGIGFWDYVIILRCSLAAKMLTSPQYASLSVSQIAFDCGFDSIRTFNRVFKAHFGVSPTSMRLNDPVSFPQ